jgi:hypothetical protein
MQQRKITFGEMRQMDIRGLLSVARITDVAIGQRSVAIVERTSESEFEAHALFDGIILSHCPHSQVSSHTESNPRDKGTKRILRR